MRITWTARLMQIKRQKKSGGSIARALREQRDADLREVLLALEPQQEVAEPSK